jgi:lipid II isoglutaminyl synthase (glutamine-hydrolysing)
VTRVVLLDLLPAGMDVNGDRGNVLALRRRLGWAGIDATVVTGDDPRWWAADPDLVHVGGPSVAGQRAALARLSGQRAALHERVADGVPVLGVAGGFHLLLDRLLLPGDREPVAGLGLLRGSSRPAARVSGFAVVETAVGRVHGYHNLGQEALLDEGTAPWGRVLLGAGNAQGRSDEGAASGRVVGTNLHGPLLPRNPRVADELLGVAAARRGIDYRPGEPHRAVDRIAERANAVLHARAAGRGSRSYVPASAGGGLRRPV